MKTRSKKQSAAKQDASQAATAAPSLPASAPNPPKLFVLPKDASSEARIVTLPNPATSTSARYFCCPEKGFYEFTRIAAPRSTPRSWLLAPERRQDATTTCESKEAEPRDDDDAADSLSNGYTMKSADVFVATPLDAVFLILPVLAPSAKDTQKQLFLSIEDHLDSLGGSSPHIRKLLRHNAVKARLEQRVAVVCDSVDAGEEKMYRLSAEKLAKELLAKAERLVANGLPVSMEDKFIRNALEVPVMNIRREDSSISAASGEGPDVTPSETADSQISSEATADSQQSAASQATTAATSVSDGAMAPPTAKPAIVAPEGVPQLLRLRTALSFMSTSYLPSSLGALVQSTLASAKLVDFGPLDTHLDHLASLRSQAQALRSLSDNISRKRGVDDDEAAEIRAEKKRKKDAEEAKKKNQSRGVKQLAKANTSGMKKLSAFFTKAPAKN